MRKRCCFLFVLIFIGLPGFSLPKDSIKSVVRSYRDAPMVKDWKGRVGAMTRPESDQLFCANDFGAKDSEYTNSTEAIQSAIDSCSKAGGGTVYFHPGIYSTGSLFLKSNVNFRVDKGVMLVGEFDDGSWPFIKTRAAGIEMKWRAAMLNVRNQNNVSITGGGVINGRGSRWYAMFKNALPVYQKKGIRWAVDYDISRPLLCQIYSSSNVTVEDVTLQESPFWTIDVVYSKNVTIDGVTIRNNVSGYGFSTDGINIDSSVFVLVQNCDVDCNDDCYSFKSGINADGLRVNIPIQYTLFRNNIARRGHGVITIGSDMSGGVRHVEASGFQGIGTFSGIRFKSSKIRGGLVEDVLIHDIKLENVRTAIEISLNWFPQFSYPQLPADSTNIPEHWEVIAKHVPEDKALPHFRDVTIADVQATGSNIGIQAEGIPDALPERFHFENVNIQAKVAGSIQYAKDWDFENVNIEGEDGKLVEIKDCENVQF